MSNNDTFALPPSSHYLTVLGREVHYMQWGDDPQAPVLLAAHGLARTGRDMDELAAWFCDRYRVICPDTIGRGLSQWSADPDAEYCLEFYARHVDRLARCARHRRAGVGRNFDGRRRRHRRGSERPARTDDPPGPQRHRAAAGRRSGRDASAPMPAIRRRSTRISELEQYFRTVYKPYGWLSDASWRRLAETSARRLPDGRVTPHYDPQIVRQFHRERDDYLALERVRQPHDSGAVPARRRIRPGAAGNHRSDAVARAARPGGRDPRLRPCTGAQYARAAGGDRKVPRRLSVPGSWGSKLLLTRNEKARTQHQAGRAVPPRCPDRPSGPLRTALQVSRNGSRSSRASAPVEPSTNRSTVEPVGPRPASEPGTGRTPRPGPVARSACARRRSTQIR